MELKRYFEMALDPIHIGTGSYRLGRVDNTIVREPGTNLPKIPGTSIEGCCRTYTYYKELEKASQDSSVKKPKEPCAVGKKIKEESPCGECKICLSFGFTKDEKSLHGMAQFSDARILFFPVYSMIGPVWVTSPNVLKEFEIDDVSVTEDKIKTKLQIDKLNLGWLYLEKEDGFSLPAEKFEEIPTEIKEKIVLVSDKLFSQIVNSNLEVRTSVSIDPETGTAEEGALFTYEAIPRATIFWFDVIYLDPSKFGLDISLNDVKNTVKTGLGLFELLGIGGMGTRGFGRLKVLDL